ncbi:MAG: LysR family transcriptional regulator substrate-binding protein, partial [Chloroflexales bacterium]|nr:LysR family transcriptional regulator substrate-binding protein [Chloroflexales bacterium]
LGPGSLATLRQRYPGVALHVQTAWTPQLLHQLRVGVLDLAVVQLPLDAPPPAGLETRPLGVERRVLVGSQRGGPDAEVDLATLARQPWVLGPEGEGGRVLLEAVARRRDLRLHVAAELEGHTIQAALVAQGVGVGLLPARLLRAGHPLAPQLQQLHVPGVELALQLWAAHAQPPARLAAPLALLEHELTSVVARGLPPEHSL